MKTQVEELEFSKLSEFEVEIYRQTYRETFRDAVARDAHSYADACEIASDAARIALALYHEFYAEG